MLTKMPMNILPGPGGHEGHFAYLGLHSDTYIQCAGCCSTRSIQHSLSHLLHPLSRMKG